MIKTDKNFYWTLFKSTFIVSMFTVGGGYVIIPLLKAKYVDEYHWISDEETLNMVAIAQSTPGIMAVNTAIHPLDKVQRAKGLEIAKPIEIGDDVWIGADVTILPGVKIGSGSVIGAKSLVTRDIPANVLAFGNPCRVVKQIGLETLLV